MPRYETYDVLDDNQLTAFLSREAARLDLRQLDHRNRLFASIASFLKGVDVIENELLDPATMPEPFTSVAVAYYETLERYRLLTYGQAVYQWRGLDVSNIVTFKDRYPNVTTFEITTNRRSRPQLIEIANEFSRTIPERIDKTMAPFRPSGGPQSEAVKWTAADEAEEAGWIAQIVLDLVDAGLPYSDRGSRPWGGEARGERVADMPPPSSSAVGERTRLVTRERGGSPPQ